MILNKTTGEKINLRIICANNFLNRLKGLMFKQNIDFGMLFITKRGSGVHTSFMKFPIDVYFLDERKKIFDKTSLNPWEFYRPKKHAKYILETKKGKLNLKKGDILDFI